MQRNFALVRGIEDNSCLRRGLLILGKRSGPIQSVPTEKRLAKDLRF